MTVTIGTLEIRLNLALLRIAALEKEVERLRDQIHEEEDDEEEEDLDEDEDEEDEDEDEEAA